MRENSDQNKKSPKLLHIAAVVSAAVLLAVGGIMAYLTDVDVRRNVITLGSVDVVLEEENYTDSQKVVPGQILRKDPKLTNTGKNDAYVFLKIGVPKAQVTLLNEEGAAAGTVKMPKSVQQIFRVLADDENAVQVPTEAKKDIAIAYHGKTDTADGWVLLGDETVSGDTKDVYVFGYSKKLSPDEPTETLFDKVQLKSIIDHELHDAADLLTDMQITVQGYTIQERNLHIEGMEDGEAQPTAVQLQSIYEIVKRKAAQSDD